MTSSFLFARKCARARPQACVRAAKSPVRQSRPGLRRNFGEYAFLEDSRYTSQAVFVEFSTIDGSAENPADFRKRSPESRDVVTSVGVRSMRVRMPLRRMRRCHC
jgi:hypothetical protein